MARRDPEAPSGAKADDLYSRLRGDILSGRFRPGERLRYAKLCEKYGTSMGVLRETLLRLAEQGLTKSEAQQGFRVTPLSVADLNELTDARVALESLTLESAIEDGDVDWESRVVAAHHRLSRTPQFDSADPNRFSEEWAAAHAEFHETLLAGCSNTHLKNITRSLRDSAELYRRWSLPFGLDVDRHISDEHTALLDAALKRDVKGAVDLLAEHIRRTTRVLLSSDAVGEGSESGAEPRSA